MTPAEPTPRRQAAACAAIAAVALLAWHGALLDPAPRVDEGTYLAAFRLAAAGEAPYAVRAFLYPPPFAAIGGWLLGVLGEAGTLALFRLANVAGLVATLWLAGGWWSFEFRHRLLLTLVLAGAAPGAAVAFGQGNLSPLALGLVFAGLELARRSALAGGAWLGASILVKPFAPAPVALLALRGGSAGFWPAGRRRGLGLALGAGATLALAWATTAFWREMLALAALPEPNTRTLSTRRLLASLGLELDATWVALAMLALVLLLARRPGLCRDPLDLVSLGGLAVVWTTPMLWVHSLLITLPVQGVAAALSAGRLAGPAADPADARRRRWEALLVFLAIAALHLADGVDGVTTEARFLQPLAYGVPLAAPLFLHLYQAAYRRAANIAR